MQLTKYLFVLLASAGVIACSNAPGTSPVAPTGAGATLNATSVAGGSSSSTQSVGVKDVDEIRGGCPEGSGEDNEITITDCGLRPQYLTIDKPGVVTFINRSTTRSYWMRSDPHVAGGHNVCPGSNGLDVFEQVGVLAPGQSGRTGVIILQSCGFHDHGFPLKLGDPGIFQGRVTVEEGYMTAPTLTASLSAVSVSPTSVTGVTSAQGTVALTFAAPAGGFGVTLSSNSAAAMVPTSVTVAAGATSATFTIATTSVTLSTVATITASAAGVTRTAALTMTPPVTYVNAVKLITDTRCTSCHIGPNPPLGLDFTTFAGVRAAVTPFSANSPLVVQTTQPNGGMVLRSGITAAESAVLLQWVLSGALQQ